MLEIDKAKLLVVRIINTSLSNIDGAAYSIYANYLQCKRLNNFLKDVLLIFRV